MLEADEQHIQVEEVIIHKDWNVTTFRNDIALLRLVRNVTLNEHIGTVCLPETDRHLNMNSTCYITGASHDITKE